MLGRQPKLITTMKKLFLILMLCCLSSAAMAQYVETVHLKNGSMIRGVIIEQIPEKTLKIQTADGSVFVYSYSEIEKITKEIPQRNERNASFSPKKPRTPIKPSYMGMVDIGYSIDVSSFGGAGRVELSTSHGCLIMPFLYVGGGVGFQYYHSASGFNIPIFADLRGYPMKGDIKPFLNIRIGYSVGDIDGLYFSPSVGVSLKRFDISVGYTMQKASVYYSDYYYSDYGSINFGAVTFKFGFRF